MISKYLMFVYQSSKMFDLEMWKTVKLMILKDVKNSEVDDIEGRHYRKPLLKVSHHVN